MNYQLEKQNHFSNLTVISSLFLLKSHTFESHGFVFVFVFVFREFYRFLGLSRAKFKNLDLSFSVSQCFSVTLVSGASGIRKRTIVVPEPKSLIAPWNTSEV
jgi:hypothetical protein